MPEPKRSLHTKLAQVMYEAERIPKNGIAPAAMGGFRFVQVGDAADAIRKALAEKQVSMIPTSVEIVGETEHMTSGDRPKAMTTMTVRTTWTLTDGESGETTVIQSLGSGADTGDKAAPKAQSNAMKYALLMGFLLSTGDDPEQTDTSDRQRTERPAPARLPAREDPATIEPVAPVNGSTPYSETTDLIGRERRQGIIRKGTSNHYKLEPHIGPEGAVIGFKLDTGKGNIPQCVTTGALGDKLMLATGGKPESLVGQRATVAGKLLYVKGNRTSEGWYRLEVDSFETDEWVLTAERDADEPALPEPPEDVPLLGEAESAPLGLVG